MHYEIESKVLPPIIINEENNDGSDFYYKLLSSLNSRFYFKINFILFEIKRT